MSYPFPTTTNEATKLALMPDWAAGVGHQTTYRTDINRSRAGLEQRAQRRKRPILSMEYQIHAQNEAARRRIEQALATARGPLLVPWWPSGGRLRVDMDSDTFVDMTTVPIAEDWPPDLAWVFLWGRDQGSEWREFSHRNGSNVHLIDTGTHIQFTAGAFCFPGRLAVREVENDMIEVPRHGEASEVLKFRTI